MGPDFWFPDDKVLLWGAEPGPAPGRHVRDASVSRSSRAWPPARRWTTVAAELARLASRLPERFGGGAAYARID